MRTERRRFDLITIAALFAMILPSPCSAADPWIRVFEPVNDTNGLLQTGRRSFTCLGDSMGAVSVTYRITQDQPQAPLLITSGTASGTDRWQFDIGPLADGGYDVIVTATAADGSSSYSGNRLIIDGTFPIADFTSPSTTYTVDVGPNAYARDGDRVTVEGVATDDIAVARVTWCVDNTLVLPGRANGQRIAYGSASGTTGWSLVTPVLSYGWAVVWVTVEDVDGHQSTIHRHIMISAPAPVDDDAPASSDSSGDLSISVSTRGMANQVAGGGCGKGSGIGGLVAAGYAITLLIARRNGR
jgi:hypothetical protein